MKQDRRRRHLRPCPSRSQIHHRLRQLQSALNIMYLLGYKAGPGTWSIYGASDERYHIVGGNSNLPVAIANTLPQSGLHLGCRMTAIALASDGSINVTFDNGKTIKLWAQDHEGWLTMDAVATLRGA
jgi:hypothetical protein